MLGSVVAPVVYYLVNRGRFEISLNIGGMCAGLIVSGLTWLAACAMLWALAKAFHKEVGFKQVASAWGLSYIPNLLCVVLYGLLQIVPGIYIGSNMLAAVFSALFIVLLVWKAIEYFLLLRFVLDTSVGEFAIVTAVSAVVFAVLILLGAKAGIRVPMV